MKKTLLVLAITSLALGGVAACVPEGGSGPPMGRALDSFSSEEDFLEYMENLPSSGGTWFGDDENQAVDAAEGDASAPPPENEEITNNQEEGVDEGGIVKNVGDYLVVLRRGRLFSVDVADSGEAQLADSIRVAPSEDLNSGVWYDEMLVQGSKIYVVGYRYVADVVGADGETDYSWIFGATEITSFSLNSDGTIERGSSTFLESNDYYSGSNYASRLVSGNLIFYMPFYAFVWSTEGQTLRIPQVLSHVEGGTFQSEGPLFEPTDIVQPLTPPTTATFHTVVQCQLPEDLTIDCGAKSLLSDFSRQFYVSRERVYLWNNDHIYAFSQIDGSARVHTTQGRPLDQFSFREHGDTLHVAVRHTIDAGGSSGTGGGGGLTPEPALNGGDDGDIIDSDSDYDYTPPETRLEILSLPLQAFDNQGEQSLDGKVKVLSTDMGWGGVNRYVGDWYLFGDSDRLVMHSVTTGETSDMGLDAPVVRIEGAGEIGAVIVQQDSGNLHLDTLLLQGSPELVEGVVLEGVSQGETRSHGFFFRPDADGGTFGLPISNPYGSGGDDYWWGPGVSNIAFFRAGLSGDLSLSGVVSSSTEAGGQCETSCIDWYGNTRPIFLRDRIYALMGSELAEVAVSDEAVDPLGEVVLLEW